MSLIVAVRLFWDCSCANFNHLLTCDCASDSLLSYYWRWVHSYTEVLKQERGWWNLTTRLCETCRRGRLLTACRKRLTVRRSRWTLKRLSHSTSHCRVASIDHV